MANIIGVDEVGRGCLAGPVVVCAYRANFLIEEGVRDSKLISPKKREALDLQLRDCGQFVLVERSAEFIDQVNILQATFHAMVEAIEKLASPGDRVLIDGNLLPSKKLFTRSDFSLEAIVQGDSKVYEIGAASIIAKVYRDRLMEDHESTFPGYFFAKNKGYGTKDHLQALMQLGPSGIHRKSFKVKSVEVEGRGSHPNS